VRGSLETYRGIVYRWEVDNVDHFTVAYYFDRFADAAETLLGAIGLGSSGPDRCVTADCYVRYLRELRVNDLLHIASGVVAIEREGLVLGHKLFNSGTGDLCSTVEQRVTGVDSNPRRPLALTATQRGAAQARRIDWDGPPRERRPSPTGLDGFRETVRDTIKPREVDVAGAATLSAYVHRFSAANGHALAAFGMTPAYMRDDRRGFSTFEFQLEFVGELHAGDLVAVKSGLLHVGTSSVRIFHKLFNDRSAELVATLDQLGVHLDLDARRPTPLPEALKDKARTLLAPTVSVA
jgi:acyl-CoA thioesterase FadM